MQLDEEMDCNEKRVLLRAVLESIGRLCIFFPPSTSPSLCFWLREAEYIPRSD